ncbi:interleukin-1 receptor-associated kinase 4-like [Corticium candelabrum]|uniref:interleukin-1 receptor-associated kinase 4-like n=1 Tax=Corticium candelabrum TaxID=121492 RepID=UPI002E273EF2|nr:interleukin-1 receptor-associated kinase 4-like [Corticium candelabrum]
MNEVSALTMCPSHPNVVQLFGICDEGRTLAQHLAKTTLETVAAKSLSADQWTKSSAPSRHCSSGDSNRQWRKDYKGSDSDADNVSSSQVTSPVSSTHASSHFSRLEVISYNTLKQATNDFNERKIDEGGSLIAAGSFGQVFLGNWQDQRVAVKRLKKPKDERLSTVRLSKKQYRNEMLALTRCPSHPNVVRLLGISDDGPEMCLVYEYVDGMTLAQHLAKESSEPLSWNERLEVAHGSAKGIHHIQTTPQRPLIHRDIKSANILVSPDGRVIVADFGLSCFVEHVDNMDASFYDSGSMAVGTRSYMSPEACKGIISTRTDVYSFGVVLFELLTGLPPYFSSKKLDLVIWLKGMEREGVDLMSMCDPRAAWPDRVARLLFDLAKRCTDFDSHRRPFIREVLQELDRVSRMGLQGILGMCLRADRLEEVIEGRGNKQ